MTYKVGDEAWIFIGSERERGTVVAVLKLDGWSEEQYVIQIETPVDSMLEVRSAFMMVQQDPRISVISTKLRDRFNLNNKDADDVAIDIITLLGIARMIL
jgi:hypothetical protein